MAECRDDEDMLQQLLLEQLDSLLACAQRVHNLRNAVLSSASNTSLHQPAAALGQELVDGLRGVTGGASLAGGDHLPASMVLLGQTYAA